MLWVVLVFALPSSSQGPPENFRSIHRLQKEAYAESMHIQHQDTLRIKKEGKSEIQKVDIQPSRMILGTVLACGIFFVVAFFISWVKKWFSS